MLYNIIGRRHAARSTIITTNLAFKQWGNVFPGAACVAALIDRFNQHCVVRRLQSCDDTEMRWPAILYLAYLAACSEHPDGVHPDGVVADESGRACATGVATGGETLGASPALDCPSLLCLHVQNLAPDECTATCATAGDCLAASASACTAGFVCQPVIAAGPFSCQSFCVCADRAFAPPAGGVTAVRPAP